jgi:hypothetical protein
MRFSILLIAAALCAWATGVDGKWTFHMDTAGGPRVVPANLSVQGEDVSGTWGRDKVKGTVKEGKLDLRATVTSDEAGQTAELKIEGKLEGEQIKGSWSWAEHNGTFHAVRGE